MHIFSRRTAPILGLALGAAALGGAGAARDSGQTNGSDTEMRARESFDQVYDLAPNSTVRVEGIAGPVTIETGSGNRAEVHVVRMAATERELQCYRTQVSAAPDRLTIEHVQFGEHPGCDSIRSRQEVRLRLPRSVNLDLSTIAGSLDVGPVDGRVRLNSIAGRVHIASARNADLNSLAGGLSMGLGPVGREGVRISSVVGPVELSLARGLDADISVNSVMGSVRSLAPDVDLVERDGAYRARVGAGGGRIAISSIVGPVRLRRP